jgi:hypothetical protein
MVMTMRVARGRRRGQGWQGDGNGNKGGGQADGKGNKEGNELFAV